MNIIEIIPLRYHMTRRATAWHLPTRTFSNLCFATRKRTPRPRLRCCMRARPPPRPCTKLNLTQGTTWTATSGFRLLTALNSSQRPLPTTNYHQYTRRTSENESLLSNNGLMQAITTEYSLTHLSTECEVTIGKIDKLRNIYMHNRN